MVTVKPVSSPPLHVPALRIGILGASSIARKNALAICASEKCKLVAIASRSRSKAVQLLEKFVDDHAIQIFSGDKEESQADGENLGAYQRLIDCPDIDALYIPLPTSLHLFWVKAALNAGKHVLVEKPVAITASEYEEMIETSQQTCKYLMDGTMFVHHPRTKQVLNFISNQEEQQSFGNVVRIYSDFSFLGDEDFFANNIRVKSKALNGDPLGCIGDLGWYCVRMAQLVFQCTQNTMPKTAQVVHYQLNEHDVPIDATCIIAFQNNSILTFHCGFLAPLTQTVSIYGLNQCIFMDDYVIPKENINSFYVQSQQLAHADTHSIHDNKEIKSDLHTVSQEAHMWNSFATYCRAYDSNSDNDDREMAKTKDASLLLQMSLQNQKIMDALILSVQRGGEKIEIS